MIAIGASGQSARAESLERARDAGAAVIVVNDTWRLAPWADLLYACDRAWWLHPGKAPGASEFRGRRMSQVHLSGSASEQAADRRFVTLNRLEYFESRHLPGLSLEPELIHTGGNGGFQALNVAVLHRPRRVVLIGFDVRGGHWHRAHPAPLNNGPASIHASWIRAFNSVLPDLAAAGVEVINTSEESALECFKKMTLEASLRC